MFNLHAKLIGTAPLTYEAGFGSGVGQSNMMGSFDKSRDNARKNRQWDIMEEEQKVRQGIEADLKAQNQASGDNAKKVVDAIQKNEKDVAELNNKRGGDIAKGSLRKVATSVSDTDAGYDYSKAVDNSEDQQNATNTPKGSSKGFDPNSKEHNDAFLRKVNQDGVDLSKESPEYVQYVKEVWSTSGLWQVKDGKMEDLSDTIIKTGSMSSASSNENSVFEGKRNRNQSLLDGEEKHKAWLKENLDDPKKKSFIRDTVNAMSPSERDEVMARTKELNGQSEDTKMDSVNKMKDDLAKEGFGPDSTAPVDPNGQGLPKTEVMDVASSDERTPTPKTVASPKTVNLPNGTTARVTTNEDGSTTSKQLDGSSVTVSKDGTATATEANGRKSMVDKSGQVTSVSADGTVTKGYTLPPSVQMAYDMVGVESQYSEKNVLAREKTKSDIAEGKMRTPAQAAVRLATDVYNKSDKGTEATKVYKQALADAENMKTTKLTNLSAEQAGVKAAIADYKIHKDPVKFQAALAKTANYKDVKPTNPNEAQIVWDEVDKMIKRDDYKTDAEYQGARADKYKELKFKPATDSGDKLPTKASSIDAAISSMKKKPTETDTEFTARKDKRFRELNTAVPTTPNDSNIQSLTKLAEKAIGPRQVGETLESYNTRINNEVIRLDRNGVKATSLPPKQQALANYNTAKDEALFQVNSKRDANSPMANSFADITTAEWEAMEPNTKQAMKDQRKLAVSTPLTDGDKSKITTNSKTINALKKLGKHYNEDVSGLAQNIGNYIQQYVGFEGYNTADIEDKAAVDSVLANLTLLEAKEMNGGRAVNKQVLEVIAEEIKGLSKTDKAVVQKYQMLISKAGDSQAMLKKNYGDDYYLYSENPDLAVSGDIGKGTQGTPPKSEAQKAVSSSMFPKR